MSLHLPALLFIFPLAGAWLSGLAGLASYGLSRVIGYLSLGLGTLATLLALSKVLVDGPWHYSLGGWPPPWGIELILTSFTAFLALFLLLAAALAYYALGSYGLMAGLLKDRESLAGSLMLLLSSALLALLVVRDGFSLYLLLQLVLLAGAGLFVGLTRQGWLDGFQFLLWGSAANGLLLGAFLFLHAATGTLHLDDILAQLFIDKDLGPALAAGTLMACSLSFLFLFPIPALFARSLGSAPPFLMGFLSALLPRVALYLLFLFLFFVLNVPGMTLPSWVTPLASLLALLPLAGFFLAARQKDFLQTAAYLSLAQLAFPFAGFVCGNKSALTGSLLELLTQLLVVLGLFLAAGSLSSKTAGSHPLAQLSGLGRQDFGLALCLVVLVFSIAGVPPTGGSFGKFYLLQGLREGKEWTLLAPLGATLLFNLWTVLRFLWMLFEHRRATSRSPLPLRVKAPVYLLALFVLLVGSFHHQIVHSIIQPALPKAYQNLPLPNIPFLGHQVE